jgi:hypothetical protein
MIVVFRCGDFATAGVKTRAMWASEMNADARQSFKRYWSLSVFVSGLTIETTAFALSTPQNDTTVSTVLSANTRTRSPRSTPRFTSAFASAFERASSSAYVRRCAPATSASLSGRRAAESVR